MTFWILLISAAFKDDDKLYYAFVIHSKCNLVINVRKQAFYSTNNVSLRILISRIVSKEKGQRGVEVQQCHHLAH